MILPFSTLDGGGIRSLPPQVIVV